MFQDCIGVWIFEGYGFIEGVCVSSVNLLGGEWCFGLIGLCIFGQMMKVVIFDDVGCYVCDCVENEVGVLMIFGLNVFVGYFQEDQNKSLWFDFGDGWQWFNIGDFV